ncbi:putative drug/proton antiporter YHK8 [Ceratocystis platani]|uniref:Putative drug/proton antiporter YHK8 n=1 Tax=Ceratocystis fimbriata f. sp. platani TaxID=88771 RepID=A0A0F8CVP5_CERFI|nr:putative drug/proton antiporter YHK8 [Ceratocystis platani]
MGTATTPPAALEKLFETSHDANPNDVLGKTKPEDNNMSSVLDHQPLDEDTHSATDSKTLQQERSGDSSGDVEAGCAQYDPAFTVGWDGGDSDPENPRSLPVLRKWAIVLITSAGSFCVTATSSIYTSTNQQIMREFNISREIAVLGLSLFVLGLSFGPMLLSPMSEFYGRRPIYISSWFMFTVWLIPSAVAHNIQTMLVARFLDGFSGSAFLAVTGGTVGDLFDKEELQVPMLIYSMAPFVGPSVGPLIGGFINYNTNWRWTYYVLLMWAGVLLILLALFVPETYHPVLLRRKAARIRKLTGDPRWLASTERQEKSLSKTLLTSLYRPFQLLVLEPMLLNLCIYSALLLGILYLFFGAFPQVFTATHGFNLWQNGLPFLGILGGMALAGALDPVWKRIRERLVAQAERDTGIPGRSEPEFRLPSLVLGAVMVPVGLFWFAWTSYSSVHWIVPIIGTAFFGGGMLLAFTGIFTFLVDAYPLYAASALAANSFVRCSVAAAFPLFGHQMFDTLGFQWAGSLLGFLAVAMMPFPYIFFKYGKRIRGKSRFATGG